MRIDEDYAQHLDQHDPLAHFRASFPFAQERIYLDGNSLGLYSLEAGDALETLASEWRRYAIDGWQQGDIPWFDFAERLGNRMAPLVGASPDEVVVTGSTTTNLHQLVATFYRPGGRRNKILADSLTFPSDLYALTSQLKLHGLDPKTHLRLVESSNGYTLAEDDIIAAMTEDVALIVLPSVLYVSGQLLDISRLTQAAHAKNILIGFDLAHSAGIIPHTLDDDEVDFAFWCTYKYLNGGPGATGALFVARRHWPLSPGLAGWFSSNKERQFDLTRELVPSATSAALQIGTPNIFSMAPLWGSLSLFEEAGMDAIRKKSLASTAYLRGLVEERLAPYGVGIVTPSEDPHRGGHLAITHGEAVRIAKALKARGVIPDFRPPEVLRLAPAPLYTSYHDLWSAVEHFVKILESHEYLHYPKEREVIA